ncbi:MAG: hypothetical protein K9G41_06825 [Flavobacteriales bacterium]|nr:hypothetical protein [Flavobacteriales bacterium]
MKTLLPILASFLVLISNVNSQELYSKNGVTISASPAITLEDDSYFGSVKSIDNNGFVAYYKSNNEWTEVEYNKNFEQIDAQSTVINYDPGKETDYNHVFSFNGRYFLLKGTVNREQKTNLFTQVELAPDGEPISEPIELASVEGDDFYANPKNAMLTHEISPDGTKLLVSLKLPEQRVGDERKHFIYKYFVYDDEMNLLWSRIFEFKHEGGIFVYSPYYKQMCFENDGGVLVWGDLERGRKVPEGVSRLAIRFYRIQENDVEIRDVDLSQRFVQGPFRYANDKVYLFSTYGTGEDIEGFSIISWNSKNNEGKLNLVPFGKEHLVKNQPEKEIKRITNLAEKGRPVILPKFDFYDVIQMENGEFIITGQEQNDKSFAGEITSTTEYHRDDFHLIAIDADCQKTWSQIIPLNQVTFWTDYGCIVKPVGDKVYCIFNDAAENLVAGWSPSGNVNRYNHKEDPVGMVIIDTKHPDAPQKRMKILDYGRLNGHLVPEQFATMTGLNVAAMRVQVGKDKAKVLWFEFED